MKRAIPILLMLLAATSALAQFPTNTSTATLNMQTSGPDFSDFTFQWNRWEDQRCTFYITNNTSVVNITNYLALFRLTGRRGTKTNTNFIDLATGDITMQNTNQITFPIARDDIPAVNTYNAQLILLSSATTQSVAVLGKGTIKVTHSLWRP